MATRAAVLRYARATTAISDLARRDLARVWAALPTANPTATRDALLDLMPALVDVYGDAAAAVAAEWFSEIRPAASSSPISVAGPLPLSQVRARVRFGVGWLFDGNPAASQRFFDGLTDELVAQRARSTIDANVRADRRALYARVPVSDTCAFCLMLAGRGPVYGSLRDAGGDGNRYHSFCDCVPTPIWPDDPLPAGYDPDALHQTYLDARSAAPNTSARDVLSELRSELDIH